MVEIELMMGVGLLCLMISSFSLAFYHPPTPQFTSFCSVLTQCYISSENINIQQTKNVLNQARFYPKKQQHFLALENFIKTWDSVKPPLPPCKDKIPSLAICLKAPLNVKCLILILTFYKI